MIIDIRGTNGSGKSYIPHTLLEEFKSTKIVSLGSTIGYLIPELELEIIGPYRTQCGGADTIKTQDEVCARIADSDARIVLVEGIIMSTIFQRYSDLAEGKDYRFRFLDTPFDICLQRVIDRSNKPPNVKLMEDKLRSIRAVFHKLTQAGKDAKYITYTQATNEILEEIRAHLAIDG